MRHFFAKHIVKPLESRIHGDMYVRFGGRHCETCRSNAVTRSVSSLQNGDQDVKKTIMLTIGGCVSFIALSEALPLFFK